MNSSKTTPLIFLLFLVSLCLGNSPSTSAQALRQWDFQPGGCPAMGTLLEPQRSQLATPSHVFPPQPASGDRPAFPATISIARVPCGFNIAEAELRMTMTATVATQRPRFTIVQRGISYGCAGIPWTGLIGEVNAGECQEFAWYDPPRGCTGFGFICPTAADLARMPPAPVTATLASRTLLTSFDPDLPFTLRVRGNWPASAPDLVYEVPGRGVQFDTSSVPADITGLWWNPAEPGWAVLIDRNWRGAVFAAWLTFDDQGNSTWFVMPNGQSVEIGVVEGAVHAMRGRPFSQLDPGSELAGEIVGRFRISFQEGRRGHFQYAVNGRTGGMPVERFDVRTRTGEVCSYFRGMMLVTGLNGWGASVDGNPAREDCSVHVTLLTYDDDGKPFWAFGGLRPFPSRFASSRGVSLEGPMYRPTGTPYGLAWDNSRFSIGPALGSWTSTFFLPADPFHRVGIALGSARREISFERFRFEF
jgi:hypothetical protein